MPATFEEPIGPLADLSELLYVVALHQASLEYREDISITAEDISLFLMSRYGAECSPKTVRECILKDVAGKRRNDDDNNDSGQNNGPTIQSDTTEDLQQQQASMAQDISDLLRSKFRVSIQPKDLKDLLMMNNNTKDTRVAQQKKEYQAIMEEHKENNNQKEQEGTEIFAPPPLSTKKKKKNCDDESDMKMDLVELVALLWIPEFRKLADLQQQQQQQEGRSFLGEKAHFFKFTCSAMMHDLAFLTGSTDTTNLEMTPSLVRDLCLRYGETTLAQDDELMEEMVQAAKSGLSKESSEEEACFLDQNTLTRALTHDITKYNFENEECLTTHWDDVFGNKEGETPSQIHAEGASFGSKLTARPIDMAAHTYLCQIQMMVNWLFFVFTYFAYIYFEIPTLTNDCEKFLYMSAWSDNHSQAKCNIGFSIVDWLCTFVLICLAGALFVGVGSIGNDLRESNFLLSLFAMACLVFLTVFYPLTYGLFIEGQGREPLVFMRLVALVMGIVSTTARLLRLMIMGSRKKIVVDHAKVPFTVLKSEALNKKASAYKIRQMQENAFSVHETLTESSVIRSHFALALANFSKLDPQYRTRFKGDSSRSDFQSGRIAQQDGVFFSGRLLAGNLAQLILCVVIFAFGYTSTTFVRDNWIPPDERDDRIAANLEMIITLAADQNLVRKAVDGSLRMFTLFLLRVLYFLDHAGLLRLDCIALGSFLQTFCQSALFDDEDDGDFACSLFTSAPEELCERMEPLFRPTTPLGKAIPFEDVASFVNTTSLVEPVAKTVSQAMSGNIAAQVNLLYPRHRHMVVVPFAVGTAVATLCALVITALFLPSITANTLKLRTGIIPSVCDPEKRLLYTKNVNSGSYIFGGMFWGILASSVLVGGLVGFILFLSLWQVTAYLIMQAVALGIGVSVTLILKWLLKRTGRIALYRGFYRKNPLVANFIGLLDESFNFATSVAFAIVRMVKLLAWAAFYVGRIDVKFLDPSANENLQGKLYIDLYPEFFLADILATEAHRHPYMERLGSMYLYKLKYGPEFATRAGSAWRLLFVTALMPWLQKYRIASRQIATESDPEDAKLVDSSDDDDQIHSA